MFSDPAISVVIPSYNAASWVAEAVRSAQAQTYAPSQIIVVDDGSRDDTREALAPCINEGIEYIFQSNAGVAAARNLGVARAKGDIIAFLDADDVWHPRKLQLQCEVLRDQPDLGLLGTYCYDWPGPAPQISGFVDGRALEEVEWSRLAVRNYFATSSIIVRRKALESLGSPAFDTELHGPEDYDLWLRIGEKWRLANLPLLLTGYRVLPGSLGNQVATMQAGMSRILQKLDERGAWRRPGGRLLRRRAHAYFHYSSAFMQGKVGNWPQSIRHVIRSAAIYPVPFRHTEVKAHFARPKLFAVTLLRLMGLKSPVKSS